MKYRRYRCACLHFSIWNAKIIKHFSGMRKKFDRQIKMAIWNMSIGKCVLLCFSFFVPQWTPGCFSYFCMKFQCVWLAKRLYNVLIFIFFCFVLMHNRYITYCTEVRFANAIWSRLHWNDAKLLHAIFSIFLTSFFFICGFLVYFCLMSQKCLEYLHCLPDP